MIDLAFGFIGLAALGAGFNFYSLTKRIERLELKLSHKEEQERITRELEEKLKALEAVEEDQYNQSYGQPDIVDYFDQEYIKKGVKQ